MTTSNFTRKLVAMMSADVKGYSRLMREDEVSTIRTLTNYRQIMGTFIQNHNGRIVDAVGDNILAEFPSVIDAMQCSIGIQKELKKQNTVLPDHRKMEFRMGINLGDVIVKGERIYGDEVNVASQLEGMSDPGGICISRGVYDQIETKVPFEYKYLGKKHFQNNGTPVQVFKVLLDRVEQRHQSEQRINTGPWDWEKYDLHDLVDKCWGQTDHLLKKLSKHVQVFQGMRERHVS